MVLEISISDASDRRPTLRIQIPPPNAVIAGETNRYVQTHIFASDTRSRFNRQKPNTQETLTKAIIAMRTKYLEKPSTRGFFRSPPDTIDPKFLAIEKMTHFTKKFALGNCGEFASLALYYVAMQYPEVNAEIGYLEPHFDLSGSGSGHEFLIIGRSLDSDSEKPETWGEEAYICDPWSEENNVYPVSEFKTKMKIHYHYIQISVDRETDGQITKKVNCTSPFNEFVHRVGVYEKESAGNSASLQRNTAKIIELYIQSHEQLKTITLQLIVDLEKITGRLTQKYGDLDDKYQIINGKINDARQLVESLEETINQNRILPQTHKIKQKLQLKAVLDEHFRRYCAIAATTKVEKEKLAHHPDDGRTATKMAGFFGMRTQTVRETNQALSKAAKEVRALLKNSSSYSPL